MSLFGVFGVARVYDRSALGGAGKTITLQAPDFAFVTSIEVKLGLGFNSRITVQLDAPYSDGVRLAESSIFRIGNVLMVKLGYSQDGQATPWFSGLLKNPGVQISPQGVQASLEAEGAGAIAMVRRTGKQFNGTVREFVSDVSARFGWELDFEGTVFGDMQKQIDVSGAGDNYWQLIRRILVDAGLNYYVANNSDGKATLYVLNREKMTSSLPVAKFVMFGAVDVENNIWPILSFSAPSKASWAFGGSAGYSQTYIDENGDVQEIKVSETTSDQSVHEGGSLEDGSSDLEHPESGQKIDLKLDDDESGAIMHNVSTTGSESDELQSRRDEVFNGVESIEGNITTIGVPNIRPGDMIEIRGVTVRFDGLWQVFEVTHTFGSGGFDSSLTLRRNSQPVGTTLQDSSGIENTGRFNA